MSHLCARRTTEIRRFHLDKVLLLALSLGLGISPSWAGSWKGQKVVEDGVPVFQNPAAGVEEPGTVPLKELWRLGGESEDEDEFFGLISQILTDEQGNIYVLDSQLHEIKVYNPNGELTNSFGREGEGPGEFRNPSSMFFLPDGNIGVMQSVPGKIVILTREGEPAGEHPLPEPEGGGFQILRGGDVCGENLALLRMTQAVNQEAQEVKLFFSIDLVDAEGNIVENLETKKSPLSFANAKITEEMFDTFENRWTVGKDGRVYACTSRDDYMYKVWGRDGKLERIVKREYTPYKRTGEEKERTEEIWSAFLRRVPNAKLEVRDTDKTIHTIYTRDDGTVWVIGASGARTQPKDAIGVFDVYDNEGHFVRQVTLQGQGDPQEDAYFFSGDRLYVVTGFLNAAVAAQGGIDSEEEMEEDITPMEIICYQLDAPVIAKGQ